MMKRPERGCGRINNDPRKYPGPALELATLHGEMDFAGVIKLRML